MTTVISLVPYRFLPARIGGQKAVALFYKYLSRRVNLLSVTTRSNDPAAAAGYEVLNILSDSPVRYIDPFYFFTLRRLIRQRQATHLILEHPYYGWLGVLLKWSTSVRLVIRSHNIEGLRWKTLGKWWWRILWSYEKWVHRRADFNLFIQDADKEYAISHFSLRPDRCMTMTYGLENDSIPPAAILAESRRQVREKHGIAADETLLFFNGAFNYPPNLHALEDLIMKVNPLLLKQSGFPYKILVCGKDIPASISGTDHPNILFAGFVDDIDLYFRGADIFLNPITEGGGIKTKLVEALGHNLTAVSASSGAIGINPAWCNGKLLIGEDGDWAAFTALILQAGEIKKDVPPQYFDHFYWDNITRRTVAFIA